MKDVVIVEVGLGPKSSGCGPAISILTSRKHDHMILCVTVFVTCAPFKMSLTFPPLILYYNLLCDTATCQDE